MKMIAKKILNYVVPLLKTILAMPSLYYFDLAADYLFAYDLGVNCHWKYLSISLFILSVSYISTALFLRFRLRLPWKRSVFYPHYHSRIFFRRLWLAIRGKVLCLLGIFSNQLMPNWIETFNFQFHRERITRKVGI